MTSQCLPKGEPLVADAVFDGQRAKFHFDTFFPPRDRFYAYGLFMKPMGEVDRERLASLRGGTIQFGFAAEPFLRFPAEAVLALGDPDFSTPVPLPEVVKTCLERAVLAPTSENIRQAAVVLARAAQATSPPWSRGDGIIRFSDHYCPITVAGLPYVVERQEDAWLQIDAEASEAAGVTLRAYLVGHKFQALMG